MKRSAMVVALALGLMAQGAMAKTLNVVSSFSVLGDMVQQVGGEHVHVDTLVGPDGDPHTFEPSPKDSALLSKADVVVVNGLIVGWVLNAAYGAPLLLSMCTVALGQAVVCYVLGLPLLHLFRKRIPEKYYK